MLSWLCGTLAYMLLWLLSLRQGAHAQKILGSLGSPSEMPPGFGAEQWIVSVIPRSTPVHGSSAPRSRCALQWRRGKSCGPHLLLDGRRLEGRGPEVLPRRRAAAAGVPVRPVRQVAHDHLGGLGLAGAGLAADQDRLALLVDHHVGERLRTAHGPSGHHSEHHYKHLILSVLLVR